jgi:hypothetical protein
MVRPPSAQLWPPDPYLIIAGALVVGAIILLVAGQWAWGLVALLGAAVVFLATRQNKRRAARYALGGLHARMAAGRDALAARSRGQIELFRARRERAELEAELNRGYQGLGRAVFAEDRAATRETKAELQHIADRIAEKETEIQALIERTDERVQRAQAGVRQTEKLEAPPEPARVPEPWPPPDEGEPPEPAEVPEPSPDQPAPEPEQAPTPQARSPSKRKQPAGSKKGG